MKTHKLNNVEISENELRELIKANPELKEEPKKGRWRADIGEEYFTILYNCVHIHTEQGFQADDDNYLTGNYYQTRELAQKAYDRQLALMRLRDYALINMPFDPDWSDEYKSKYAVDYDHDDKKFYYGFYSINQVQTELPFFKSSEDVEKFIKNNESDLKLVFGLE